MLYIEIKPMAIRNTYSIRVDDARYYSYSTDTFEKIERSTISKGDNQAARMYVLYRP